MALAILAPGQRAPLAHDLGAVFGAELERARLDERAHVLDAGFLPGLARTLGVHAVVGEVREQPVALAARVHVDFPTSPFRSEHRQLLGDLRRVQLRAVVGLEHDDLAAREALGGHAEAVAVAPADVASDDDAPRAVARQFPPEGQEVSAVGAGHVDERVAVFHPVGEVLPPELIAETAEHGRPPLVTHVHGAEREDFLDHGLRRRVVEDVVREDALEVTPRVDERVIERGPVVQRPGTDLFALVRLARALLVEEAHRVEPGAAAQDDLPAAERVGVHELGAKDTVHHVAKLGIVCGKRPRLIDGHAPEAARLAAHLFDLHAVFRAAEDDLVPVGQGRRVLLPVEFDAERVLLVELDERRPHDADGVLDGERDEQARPVRPLVKLLEQPRGNHMAAAAAPAFFEDLFRARVGDDGALRGVQIREDAPPRAVFVVGHVPSGELPLEPPRVVLDNHGLSVTP